MKKPKWYFCELWRMNYYFMIGWKFEDYCKYVLKAYDYKVSKDPKPIGQCLMLEHGDKTIILIWVQDKTDMATLAHECLHAANRTLGRAGWQWDAWNDEPQAYLMTNLILQAMAKGIKK